MKKKSIQIVNGVKQGHALFALLLLMPALFHFFVFWLYPNYKSIIYAFQDMDGDWYLGNFTWALSQLRTADGYFTIAVRNTLYFFVAGYFGTQTLNILLSYFFYKKIKGHRFFKIVMYMPNMIAGVVFVAMYKNLIGPEGPIISFLFENGFIEKRLMLLYSSDTAITASVAYGFWLYLGGTFLLCTGAMARIPKELLEAAALDGITPFKEFIHIILPMISGTLSTLYLIGISSIWMSGGQTLYLTYGEYETMTLNFWIFKQMYTGGDAGTTSAIGLLITAATLPLVFIVRTLSKKITAEVSY